jgi:hypothetical protein
MLKKILSGYAIAGRLGISRKGLVFLEHLHRVATNTSTRSIRIEGVVPRTRTTVTAVSTAATSLWVIALSHSSFTSACTEGARPLDGACARSTKWSTARRSAMRELTTAQERRVASDM